MKYYLRSLIPDPDRRRVLLSIIGVVSVYGLTIGFIYPLISLKMELRGFSSTWIGVMGALPFIASIIFSPITPLAMRYFNPTKLVFVSIAADISLILLMAFFENIYVWFACRFLMGVAGSVLFIVSETWINEIAEDRVRGRVLSLYTFTISATLAISPMFIFILGAEGSLPFFVAVSLMIFSVYPLRWTKNSSLDYSDSRVSHVTKFIFLAPTAVAASALMAFEEASVLTMLPVYALRNGLTEQTSALFLTVLAFGSMAVQPIIGSLADRFNRYNLLIISAVGCDVRRNVAASYHSNESFRLDRDVYMGRSHICNLHTCADHHWSSISRRSTRGRQCCIWINVGSSWRFSATFRRHRDDDLGPERLCIRTGSSIDRLYRAGNRASPDSTGLTGFSLQNLS